MRFRRYLKYLERGLDVPYPERESLLKEISTHLEDLYDELRQEGLDETAAEAKAIRVMALDDSFVASIDEVHAPVVRKALALLPPPVSVVIEHVGIGLLAAVVLITVIVQEEAMIKFFAEMGVFMFPLNLMGLAILILAGERVFSLLQTEVEDLAAEHPNNLYLTGSSGFPLLEQLRRLHCQACA